MQQGVAVRRWLRVPPTKTENATSPARAPANPAAAHLPEEGQARARLWNSPGGDVVDHAEAGGADRPGNVDAAQEGGVDLAFVALVDLEAADGEVDPGADDGGDGAAAAGRGDVHGAEDAIEEGEALDDAAGAEEVIGGEAAQLEGGVGGGGAAARW